MSRCGSRKLSSTDCLKRNEVPWETILERLAEGKGSSSRCFPFRISPDFPSKLSQFPPAKNWTRSKVRSPPQRHQVMLSKKRGIIRAVPSAFPT